jgi:hypothetical protein
LSPGVILSFVLLGIFLIAVKKAVAWYRSKKKAGEMTGGSTEN